MKKVGVPFLAGDDANLLAFPMRRDQPRLPPLVIRGVDDMEDVAVGEAQALAGQTAVPRPVIVKQSSARTKLHTLAALPCFSQNKCSISKILTMSNVKSVKSISGNSCKNSSNETW